MHIIYFLQAQIAKLLLSIYKMAGLRVGSWLGGQLGRILGRVARERHIAAANLKQALPHLSDGEQKQILDKCWFNWGVWSASFRIWKKLPVKQKHAFR